MTSSAATTSDCGTERPRPEIFDLQITALDPPQLLKSLLETAHFGLIVRVIRIKRHQHAGPPHPFRLLRPRREWPRDCCTREKRGEHAPLHVAELSIFRPCCEREMQQSPWRKLI